MKKTTLQLFGPRTRILFLVEWNLITVLRETLKLSC